MDLGRYIKDAGYYIKEFEKWKASEVVIDSQKAIWTLQSPTEIWRKVCLFKDGGHLYVYGDYGNFTFDNMTWNGTIYNLAYDNLGYQAEKLSHESRQSLFGLFDDSQCKKDILKWLRDYLEENDVTEEKIKAAEDFMIYDKMYYYTSDCEINEFCEEHDLTDYFDALLFVNEALDHVDEYEWIAFLRRTDFSDFDEVCESNLWNAGKVTNKRYYICMYALQVCKEKLSATIK